MFSLFWNVRKKLNIKIKIYAEKKHISISLKDLSVVLNSHGRHGFYVNAFNVFAYFGFT